MDKATVSSSCASSAVSLWRAHPCISCSWEQQIKVVLALEDLLEELVETKSLFHIGTENWILPSSLGREFTILHPIPLARKWGRPFQALCPILASLARSPQGHMVGATAKKLD